MVGNDNQALFVYWLDKTYFITFINHLSVSLSISTDVLISTLLQHVLIETIIIVYKIAIFNEKSCLIWVVNCGTPSHLHLK